MDGPIKTVRRVNSGSRPREIEQARGKSRDNIERKVEERTRGLTATIEALLKSEGMYRALTENTSDHSFVIDRDGIFKYASPAVTRASGFTLDDFIDHSLERFVPPDDLKVLQTAFHEAIDKPDETVFVPHFNAINKDGGVTYAEALVTDMTAVEGVEGIVVHLRDKVFEPFDRLGAESSNVTGSGIGLTVTKQLIESMGGSVWFESKVGEGTTFWINVPIAESKVEADAALLLVSVSGTSPD
jgi:PAS domain S-box-containing protein